MTMITYENFRIAVANTWGDISVEEVKNSFSKEIESKRLIYRIHTLAELLTILEERDVINENDVHILKKLAKLLNNNECLNSIEEYEKHNNISNKCPQCNVFTEHAPVEKPQEEQEPTECVEKENHSDDEPEIELKLCINYLVGKLDRRWPFLARNLGVDDTVISNIQYSCDRDIKEEIYQFFKHWLEINGDKASKDVLMTALRKNKRLDLVNDLIKEKYRT